MTEPKWVGELRMMAEKECEGTSVLEMVVARVRIALTLPGHSASSTWARALGGGPRLAEFIAWQGIPSAGAAVGAYVARAEEYLEYLDGIGGVGVARLHEHLEAKKRGACG